MLVPSGRVLSALDITVLKTMHERGFVRYREEPYQLKSGILSHVYVFGRDDFTTSPRLLDLVGTKICQLVNRERQMSITDKTACLIGIPAAGTPFAVAGAMASKDMVPTVECRIMREIKKQHGAHQTWIDGEPDLERHTYWLVDNVATDGKTKLEATKKWVEDNYPARPPCFIWIDRQQGAVKRLQKEGFNRIVVAYNLLDITFALGELGLWPKETVKAVEDEIAAHQLAT